MVFSAGPALAKASPPQDGFRQQYDWDAPPRELNEMQRRGFRDGVEGARRDYGNGRRPDVNNREEYRIPQDLPHDIPPQMREVWRDGFRRGYAVAAAHLWSAAPPPPPPVSPQPPDWDDWGMRGLRSDAQRQGFREGVEEARKDFQWHRRPDPDDHEEYQNPYVAPEFVDEYREGFMRGYTVAMSQLTGEQPWQQYNGDPDQWRAPDSYSDAERQGFHDGIVGARRDYGNNRRPDPNNRDEYRNPNVPDQFRWEYREGFRRGYEIAAARLWGGM
jgi:hypothetical protein